MAASTEVRTLNRPPPHLEGNLVLHKQAKLGIPRSERRFFVLLETVIHQYKAERMYRKGHKPIKEFEIRLEEVCGITESLIPSKEYKNCSFSLTLNNGMEHTFSAESREEMEEWVKGLRASKEFWAQYHKRKDVKKRTRETITQCMDAISGHNDDKMDATLSHQPSEDSQLAQVKVTTWDGVTHKVVLPFVFDMGQLLSALSGKVQGAKCATCPTCKLQQSSMEIWTVDESGIGKKLHPEDGPVDVLKLGRHYYVLVHNYKLLIIHFEDGTFQVLPELVSLKAKEVPYLPIFADKLSSLGCTNFGLFLVNGEGTSVPFHREDEPLKHSFPGRLVLRNRALTILSPVTRTRSAMQRDHLQKAQRNRNYQKALKRVEREKCKQRSNCLGRPSNSTAFSPPPNGLELCMDHYGHTDDQSVTRTSKSCVRAEMTPAASTNVSASFQYNVGERRKGSSEVLRSTVSRSDNNFTGKVLVDECLVRNELPDAGERENARNGLIERVKVSEKGADKGELKMRENEKNVQNNTCCAPSALLSSFASSLSNEATNEESLKPSKSSANTEQACEQREESARLRSNDFNAGNCFSKEGDTRETRDGDEYALADGNGNKSKIGSESGEDEKIEPVMMGYEFVNDKSIASSWSDGTSDLQTGNPENEEITAAKGSESFCSEESEQSREQSDGENNNKGSVPCSMVATNNEETLPSSSSPPSTTMPLDDAQFGFGKSDAELQKQMPYPLVSRIERANEIPEQVVYTKEGDGNHFESSVCKKRPVIEIHQCEYTIVGSPRVLDLVLKVCSAQKRNEEEVGGANMLSRICLSGWHLQYELGTWTVMEKGRSLTFDSDLPEVLKVQLTETLQAFFHKEDKVWTVVESQHVVKEEPIQPTEMESLIANCALNVVENRLELSGILASRDNLDVVSADDAPKADASVDSAKLNLEINQPCEAHPTEREDRSENTNCGRSPQGQLHAAVQGIFLHMSMCCDSPEDALNGSKNDVLIERIFKPLCIALWNVLSVGLRKKRFFGRHTVWDVVEILKDVSGNVLRIVEWINKKYPCLGQLEKFQVFVCECLNLGRGTLHLWLASLVRQKQRLTKYYNQEGVIFQLPYENLEEIVLDLSRISSLPFELHSERWIKVPEYMNKPAFSFE